MLETMTEVTHALFQDFVRANRFVVIHFRADWNLYDAEMKAILESQTPAGTGDPIALGTFDTEPAEHHDICREHKIRNIPFLAFYRDGVLVHTLTGMRNPDEIMVRRKRTSNRIFAAAIFGAEVESCRHRESSIAGTGAVRKRIK